MGWQSLDVELRALVKEWEAKKHKIEKELESLHTIIRINQERGSSVDASGQHASTYAQELTGAIYDTLLSERPLHRMGILGKVAERGIHVGGTKPVNSIGSYLSTDQRLQELRQGNVDIGGGTTVRNAFNWFYSRFRISSSYTGARS